MELQATIKDTGEDVTCVVINGGKREAFRVGLTDFIASIDDTKVMTYSDPIGEIPEGLIDFWYARNSAKFSGRALIKRVASKIVYNYCGKSFFVPMPDLIFDIYIRNGKMERSITAVFALNKEQQLCTYPYTNVYPGGRVCWGSLAVPDVNALRECDNLINFFLSAENNSDLSCRESLACAQVTSMGDFLKVMEGKEEFPEEWLVPTGKSLEMLKKSPAK